jgi:hypothetical protein
VRDGGVQVLQSLIISLLIHKEHTSAVISVGILTIGAYGGGKIIIGSGGILQLKVAYDSVDVCVGNLLLLPNEHIEVSNSLLELLIKQARYATALVGTREVRAKVDGLVEIIKCVVVIA